MSALLRPVQPLPPMQCRLIARARARARARAHTHARGRGHATGALVLMVALLGGCTAAPPSTGLSALFPLEAGHRWDYALRTEWETNTVDQETRVISTLGASSMGDKTAWLRRSEDGVDWWLRSDASGVYRVASKNELEAEPALDAQPRFVLKAPLQVGTTWQHSTAPYLLRRRQDFPPEIRHTHPSVPMSFSIVAVDEVVETPVGRFERCVRVRGQAVVKLFADPVGGWREMPLTQTEWYCPGPGLVRLVREEPAASTFLTGGKLSMELRAFE